MTPNHAYMKYGSGVRDLTLDTNTDTVYVHPSEKQCGYSVDLSNYVTKDQFGGSIQTKTLNKVSGTITYDTAPAACMLLLFGSSSWMNYGPFLIPQGFKTGTESLYTINTDSPGDLYAVVTKTSLNGATFRWTCDMDDSLASYPEKSFVVAFFS